MGPILIFDKSTLESLNSDEALWLDTFFSSNITPLFFIETLADLEKEVKKRRTPEDVVGSLAYKTPDMSSRPNVHHTTLLAGELSGSGEVEMGDGRPIVSGGQVKELGGKTGIVFERSPEEEAFGRWQNKEFLDIERLYAKAWRRALSNVNFDQNYKLFQMFFPLGKPKSLADVKKFVDFHIDGPDQEKILIFGLSLLGVPPHSQKQTIIRWSNSGKPIIRQFAPYFTHVFSVDLFFYFAIAADLIGRRRSSHKIDFAYLYYLPFCMVFVSNDTLHSDLVPFFLRENQTFVHGSEIKADLARLDKHYETLPDEIKQQGVIRFAPYPPTDDSFLVTRLWDKHMSPTWRKDQDKDIIEDTDHETQKKIVEHIKQFVEKSTVLPDSRISSDEADQMVIERKVLGRKGKWNRFPPEVMNKQNPKNKGVAP